MEAGGQKKVMESCSGSTEGVWCHTHIPQWPALPSSSIIAFLGAHTGAHHVDQRVNCPAKCVFLPPRQEGLVGPSQAQPGWPQASQRCHWTAGSITAPVAAFTAESLSLTVLALHMSTVNDGWAGKQSWRQRGEDKQCWLLWLDATLKSWRVVQCSSKRLARHLHHGAAHTHRHRWTNCLSRGCANSRPWVSVSVK